MSKIRIHQASLLIEAKSQLGEGPLWHPSEKVLYWVDITPGLLNRWNPSTGQIQQWEMGCMIGMVAPARNGGLIVALETGIFHFIPKKGFTALAGFPEPPEQGNRFNDGKCDPSGRLWVGTMNKQVLPKVGNLYCFDGEKLTGKLSDLTISNGMAWSADCQSFYFIDSDEYAVMAFDFDQTTSDISNKRMVIDVPREMGAPDGMTIDNDGMLWIAHWGGSCVARWNPATGKLLEKVEVLAPHVSCCTFGGEDMQTLYITSAREGLTKKQLQEFPHSGDVFCFKTNTNGKDSFEFITRMRRKL